MASKVEHVVIITLALGIPPLNKRDAASNGMSDCFDFAQPPLPPPRT